MAQKLIVEMTDDIDGSPAERTISFSINGTSYEIDLGQRNADKLTKAVQPFIGAARKARSSTRRSRTSGTSGPSAQDVRAWARGQGLHVSERGRIPAELIVKFQAAGQ